MVLDEIVVTGVCLEHPDFQQQSSQSGKLSPGGSSTSSKLKNCSTDLSDTNSNTNSINSSNNDSCNYSLSTDCSSGSNEGSSLGPAFSKIYPCRQLDSIFERQLNCSNLNLTSLSSLSLPVKGASKSLKDSPEMSIKHTRNKTRPRSLRSDLPGFGSCHNRSPNSSSCKNFDFAQYPARPTHDPEEGSSSDQHSGSFPPNPAQKYSTDSTNNLNYKSFSDCMQSDSDTEFPRSPPMLLRINGESSSSLPERKLTHPFGHVGSTRSLQRPSNVQLEPEKRRRPATPCSTCSTKINLLLLGAKGVGKSALAVRFLTHRFIGEYHSAVTIVYRHALVVDHTERILEIVDSSTKPGEQSVPESEIARADSVAVVYSVTDVGSFATARSCLQHVQELRHFPPPIALMANKLDLDHCRLVARNEGEKLASEFGAHYAEVSAAESSADIEPTFLYLVEQAAGSSSSQCHLKATPSKSLLSFRNSLSPSAIRRFGKSKNEHGQSPVHGLVPSSASGICESSHFSSVGSESCSVRNSRSKRKGDSACSPRCRSYDDSMTYCKMEILDSDATRSFSLAPKVCPTTRRKLAPTKKIRPYMPTGRSKRREKSSSITKSFASKTSVSDDVFFPPAKKCFSNLVLPSSGSSRLTLIEDESTMSTPQLKHPAQISRSVDQNLQKIEHTADLNLTENEDRKFTTGEKPLSLLQRGRSFIQEAKEKHWRDRDLRLSLRNFGSRLDVSRAEKPNASQLMGPTPFPRSTNRSKKLPTEGKTWVCHHEDEEEKTKILAEALQVPSLACKNEFPNIQNGKPHSAPASATVRELEPMGDGAMKHQLLSPKPPGPNERSRKFSVFNKTFSGFWARNSMPDLPKATVNIYDKLDSFKKSLKKRSV